MPDIGVPELLIVAFVVVLLFGPGKAADLGGALGKSIREFRKASNEDDSSAQTSTASAMLPEAATQTQVTAPASGGGEAAAALVRFCTGCGGQNRREAKFCTACGATMTVSA